MHGKDEKSQESEPSKIQFRILVLPKMAKFRPELWFRPEYTGIWDDTE